MPTYSYQCDACQAEFDKEQRISEDPIKKCPKCGKLKVRRMISSGNFILKGGGWYSDGYGSGKGSNKSEPSSSSSSSPTTPPSSPPSSGSPPAASSSD
jgi:putative FmdB family regulatory protein